MSKGSKLHAAWYLARFYKMSYVEGVERNKKTHNIVDLRHLSLYVEGVESPFDLQCRF